LVYVVVSVALGLIFPSQALEHYEDLADIKRAIVHTNVLPAEVSFYFMCHAKYLMWLLSQSG
jgi:hypothetical protein